MLDGGVAEDFPHVSSDVDAGIRAGQLRALVLVGIENTERRRDLTGPTEVEADRKIAPRVGGAGLFRLFLASELTQEVRERYRVTEERGLIGESLAGLFTVETLFTQLELFSKYIALDPSLWWNKEELVSRAAPRLKERPKLHATLYLATAGDSSIQTSAARLQAALRASAPAGLKWQIEPHPELRHDNIYRLLSPQVLRKLYAP